MTKDRNRFILLNLVSYFVFSYGSTKVTTYLSAQGFDPFQRGLVLSAVAVGTLVLQVLFGYLTDKFQTARKVALVGLGVQFVVAGFMFNSSVSLLLYHIIVFGMYGGLTNALSGHFDTWVMGVEDESLRQAMSFVRSFGSLGWALGSVGSALVIEHFGYGVLKVSALILLGVSAWLVYVLPDTAPLDTARAKIDRREVLTLFHQADYVLLVATLLLAYSLVVAANGVVIDKMLALGASDFDISVKWFASGLLEIPIFMGTTHLLRRIRPIRLLQLAALAGTTQFIAFAYFETVTPLIVFSTFQMFTIPLLTVASKYIIAQITPEHLSNTAQMLALGIYTGVSALIVPPVVGYFVTIVGFNPVIWGLSLFGVFAILGMQLFISMEEVSST